ncbi:hypothetical protein V8E36_005240 [Tilletia maclaganii]
MVPASINNLAYGFGACSYAGNAAKLIVNAAGSSPSPIDAATNPVSIPSAVIASGLPAVLNVPAAGGSIHAGPFKGASANSCIMFSFGDVNARHNRLQGRRHPHRPQRLHRLPSPGPPCLARLRCCRRHRCRHYHHSLPPLPRPSHHGHQLHRWSGYTYNCTFTAVVRVSLGGVKASDARVTSESVTSIASGQGDIFFSQALVNNITLECPRSAARAVVPLQRTARQPHVKYRNLVHVVGPAPAPTQAPDDPALDAPENAIVIKDGGVNKLLSAAPALFHGFT